MASELNYKEYSLKNLENWLYDAMSAGEATPQEIYDVIVEVVKDNYYTHKKQASEAYELLALLNGNGSKHLTCDKDDASPECKKSWESFWEDNMTPWGHSDLEALSSYYPHPDQPVYTEEELNAMCDAAEAEEKEKCREYNLREAEYYDKRAQLDIEAKKIKAAGGYEWTPISSKDKVVKWQLPVEIDASGEYFVTFPDDLLEAANLKEGDAIEWVDNKDGSFTLRKITKPLGMDEC